MSTEKPKRPMGPKTFKGLEVIKESLSQAGSVDRDQLRAKRVSRWVIGRLGTLGFIEQVTPIIGGAGAIASRRRVPLSWPRVRTAEFFNH